MAAKLAPIEDLEPCVHWARGGGLKPGALKCEFFISHSILRTEIPTPLDLSFRVRIPVPRIERNMKKGEEEEANKGEWGEQLGRGGHDNEIRACPVNRTGLVYQTHYNG